MSEVLKAISIAWFINLIVFTLSLFLFNYYDHIDNWSAGAWEAITITSGFTKLFLSMAFVVYISEHGLNGLKKEGKRV